MIEEENLEDLDINIRKLVRKQPPIAIDFHAFKDEYGLLTEGINHMINNKDIQKVEFKEVFGVAQERVVTLLLIIIMFKWCIESRRSIQLSMVRWISLKVN